MKESIIQILIQHGADDCLKRKKEGEDKEKTALDILMDKNPSTVKAILDDKIYTNGQDLNSEHLLLVFDLDVIQKSEQSAELNEMTLHSKISNVKEQKLLEHPLSEAFLVLKGQLLRRYNVSNIVIYLCYAFFLSFLGRTATKLRQHCDVGDPNGDPVTKICACLTSSNHSESVLSWECMSSHHNESGRFWFSWYVTFVLILFVLVREATQIYSNPRRYFTDPENWLEIGMLGIALTYMVTLLVALNWSPHFGALSVLIAWLDFFLMLGRFPSVGHYIFMCWTVTKLILRFVLIFLCIVAGFACSFHILLPSTNSFDQLWITLLKCLVMMSGEFEFDDTFTSDAIRSAVVDNLPRLIIYECMFNCTRDFKGQESISNSILINCTEDCLQDESTTNLNVNVTPQLVFILFFFLVSIVIANLLIGLTVNRTDDVEKASVVLRLERTLNQIIAIEDFLLDKMAKSRFLPDKVKEWLINMTQIFPYIDTARNTKSEKGLKKVDQGYKICIRPYESVKESWSAYQGLDFLGLSALLNLDGHLVYIYNEKSGSVGNRCNRLALPESITSRSLKLVEKRRQDILNGGLASLTDPTRVKRRWTGGHIMGPLVINSKISRPDEKLLMRGTSIDTTVSSNADSMNSFASANTIHVTIDDEDENMEEHSNGTIL